MPQARELADHAGGEAGAAVNAVIDEILARPEHVWQAAGKPVAAAPKAAPAH